jgi:hypothetical protein
MNNLIVTETNKKVQHSRLHFVYQSANGGQSEYCLDKWQEAGHYITTVLPEGYRTLRKDRVIQYLSGEAALVDPRPSPELFKLKKYTFKRSKDEICFTGFTKQQRAELSLLSSTAGMIERKSVTQNLKYLCVGKTAGPNKVAKARHAGILLLLEADFLTLLETGELPDSQIPHSQRMQVDPPIFDDKGHLVEFEFNLSSCFLEALDIKLTPRIDIEDVSDDDLVGMAWSQSCPPLFSFRQSDIIHRRDGLETIQLIQAQAGHDKVVFFDLYRGNVKYETWKATQTALVRYLVCGKINLSEMQLIENKKI